MRFGALWNWRSRAWIDNPHDAGALYALGVSYGLRGNYNFAVRKAYLDALHDIGYARKFRNRVTRMDPGMVDAELTQGVFEYVMAQSGGQ